ncbi:hypothetical protein PAXRUDRAFT_412132 [Paxillus rubicundulus Ve08.2h10]|uniref:Uncharacterized protein n=1 Tax=Paxillus rubicundulus Ve08.2h10 TaxID=930991 RepID=A0A0D0E2T8_9AGAM|nr:hypothetical protein PAXRUDRAFT_412132 [Paxillus rubicundulus Ve08.2h10]
MELTLTLICLARRFTYLLRLISSRVTSCLRYISAFFRRHALDLFKPLPRSMHEDRLAKHPGTIARSGGRPSLVPDNEVGSSTQGCYILESAAVSPGFPNSASSDPSTSTTLLTARISTVGSSSLQVSPTCNSTPVTPTQRRTKELQPFSPEETNRYKRSAHIHRKTSPKPIPPLKLDYSRPCDHEWKRCTHPEGALYFNLEGDGRRATTDSNMDDQHTRDLANTFVRKLWRKLDHAKYPAVELVIDISHDEQSVTCKYYFISHQYLAVFWLSDYIPDCIFHGVEGVEASDHIRRCPVLVTTPSCCSLS